MKLLDKAILFIAVIAGFVTAVQFFIFCFLNIRGIPGMHSASSVGIIGGADGPTAVYLSSDSNFLERLLSLCPYIAAAAALILLIRKTICK